MLLISLQSVLISTIDVLAEVPCVVSSHTCPPTVAAARLLPHPTCVQRADEIAAEKNRALKAALNAELRKTKATLLEQAIPLLDKMARKGKGLTPEKIAARQAQVRSRAGHVFHPFTAEMAVV